jgi:hypothetical protein
MAKISTYPILSNPTANDILIGTDVEDLNITKNFSIGSIIGIVSDDFVPYVGATGNVNLGAFSITAGSFIIPGGLATQFVKADGSLDSTVYVPASRTLTINSITFDLSANRSWDLNTINSLTTTGTSGPATYIGKTLNIPQYQAQGNYITQLSGEATAVGPGNATVTLSNLAVINKVLTGLNITGGTVVDTDSILTAFGKVQNQINGLAGGVTYEGTWNAATNVPLLQSSVGVQGHYYVVSVAGNTNLNGITDWQIGDWAIFNGSVWQKVDNTDAVVSVNGYTGAVVLTFSDVGAPPATRNLTINGVQFDLTADRTWTVGDVRTDQTYANPSWITSLAWTKITGTPTTLAGYGITDGALNTTELTINGITFNLTANRTWNVGTVTSIATTGPLTGGTITGSGTIGITQAGASSDGYLSSTDWNTFNNKQNALTNPVTGTGTIFTLPMWGGATSLIDSPLSYGSDNFNFQYNSATGGSVTFTNSGLTAYAYTIQMNNFGSPRSTIHSYTDGLVIQSIGGTQVSRMFANGNFILGNGVVDNGHKLEVTGTLALRASASASAATQVPVFIADPSGTTRELVTRTPAQLLGDAGAISGTGASGQVAYFNGTTSLTSSATFAFTPTSQLLVNNSVTAASAIARGTNLTPTLTAAANNDVLVGLDINPTFTNGAFTGVRNFGLRVGSFFNVDVANQSLNLINESAGTTNRGIAIYQNNNGVQAAAMQFYKSRGTNASPTAVTSGDIVGAFAFNSYVGSAYTTDRALFGANMATTTGIGIYFIAGSTNSNYNPSVYIHPTNNVVIGSSQSILSGITDTGFRLDVNGTARVQGELTVNTIQIGLGGGAISTNTRVGLNALRDNTTGTNNTAFGLSGLQANTTGTQNTAVGVGSLISNTTASNNTATGFFALGANTTGINNTAFGSSALRNSTTSSANSAFGLSALQNNTTGGNNTAVGGSSSQFNTTGSNNTTIGTIALLNNTTGGNNTAIGQSAARFIADGTTALTIANNSIFIGVETRALADNQTNQIVIGHTAIGLGSNTTVIGNSSTTFGRWFGNLLVGTSTNAGFALDVNGTARVQGVLTTTADAVVNGVNIGIGGASSPNNSTKVGRGSFSNNTGQHNSAFGSTAMGVNTSGANNSAFGSSSLQTNSTGFNNCAFGLQSLSSNSTSSNNSAFGTFALRDNSGASNSAFGTRTLQANTSASNNSGFGSFSLESNTTGASNSAFGTNSLHSNIDGSNNIALGFNAGRLAGAGTTEMTSVNNSIYLGYQTRGLNATGTTNEIVIGYNVVGLGSNTTVLGNSSTTFGRWYGNLLLGTTTNAASSILTIESTTQGFLPPRMTTTQRNAIVSPATGLIVYDNTLNDPFYFNGTAWTMLQDSITLTTTGTSGPATLIGNVLNVPNYTTDLSGYVTLATDQTITGLKTILRGGDVLNFKIGTDTLYGLKVAYNQNELVPSGEATWSFVNTFNRNGTGYDTTPISFFRGVLVTGERLLSASINTNLLDYYGNNPSGRYPIYAYNTGVQQFASSIIVGETNGVVNAVTGAIADLPAGVVANFKGRVIGSDAVNNNEFATLGQVTSGSRAAISLTTTGTSGPATYSSVTGVLNIPEYQGGVTSFNTRTGAVTLSSLDVTTALGFNPVTDARTLTINGVGYDLTANRSWTVGVNPSAREIQTYIATALQTTFTVTGGYTVGLVDVFINGVRLTSSDYAATNGTTVVLTTPTMAGNIVDIIKYTSGIVNSISGTGTTNELAYFTASTTIASLSTATYPSLTELSYVKGVTSSIQTQLNGKQNALTNPVTGTISTGQVAFGTAANTVGGDNGLFWDNTNKRLGVGTNAPANILDIQPASGSPRLRIARVGGAELAIDSSILTTGALIRTINNSPLSLGVNSSTTIVINTSFNVGIETTSPTARLDVNGTGRIRNGVFLADTSGNVVIGSLTDAGFRLDVNGTGRFSGAISSTITNNLVLFANTATTQFVYMALANSIGNARYGVDNSSGGGLGTGTSANSAVFGNAGNADVDITTNNISRLKIASTGAATFSSSVTATSNYNLINNAGSVGALVFVESSVNRAFVQYLSPTFSTASRANSLELGTISSGSFIAFRPLDSEAMRITSGGNVGIGTASPSMRLHVLNNQVGDSSILQLRLEGNGGNYFDLGRQSNTGHFIIQGNQTGFNNISLAPTSGNVLIGTTTDNGNKLQVNGVATFSNAIVPNGGVFALGDVLTSSGRLLASNGNQVTNNESASLLLGNRGYFTTSDIGAARISAVSTGTFWYSGTALAFYTNPGPDVTSTGALERMRITANGNIGMPTTYGFTTSNAANLYIDSGAGLLYRSTSSIKYKRNVKNYDKGLDVLSKMRPVYYDGIGASDSGKTFAGLIAEEIHELGLTEFVQYGEDGTPDALAYSNMVALLVKAIQELQAKLDKNNIN